MWEFRNGILHGQTSQEIEARELAAIQKQIVAAYEEYNEDNFIVPRYLCSLFTTRSLQQRLAMDIDSMKSWLRSVTEAKATQEESTKRYALAAKTLFTPRKRSIKTETTTQPRKHEVTSPISSPYPSDNSSTSEITYLSLSNTTIDSQASQISSDSV